MKKILSIVIILFISWSGMAQCDTSGSIPVTSNSDNQTFLANTNYHVSGSNVVLQWTMSFQNNVTICIQPGAKLKLNNQLVGSAGNQVTFNVYGTLEIPNNWPSSFNFNIYNGGKVTGLNNNSNQDIGFNGSNLNVNISSGGLFTFKNLICNNTGTNTIVNNGTFKLNGNDLSVGASTLNLTNNGSMLITGNLNLGTGSNVNYVTNNGYLDINGEINSQSSKLQLINNDVLEVTQNLTYGNNGPNKFENYGTYNCKGIYSTDPTLHMKNEGDMTTTANYDDTVGSFFSNCGTLHMSQNWANLQGTIINTGDMTVTVSSVAFANTGKIENYSSMTLQGVTMGNTTDAVFYNEGEVTFTSNSIYDMKLAGPGSSYQPTHSTSAAYGRFNWPGKSYGNGWIKGNLNLVNTQSASTQTAMLDNGYAVDPTVVFGACSCTVVVDYDSCANSDGTWPDPEPTGPDCIPVNRHIRSKI